MVRLFFLLFGVLFPSGGNQKTNTATGAENQEGACNGEPAGAVVAGSGQVKAGVLTTFRGASALAEPLSVSMVTALPSTVAEAVSR